MATKLRQPETQPPLVARRSPGPGARAPVETTRARAGPADRAAPARATGQADRPGGSPSDNLLSVAYATEEILKVAVPVDRDPGVLGRDARSPSASWPCSRSCSSRIARRSGPTLAPAGPTSLRRTTSDFRRPSWPAWCSSRTTCSPVSGLGGRGRGGDHHLRRRSFTALPGVALGRIHLVHCLGQPAGRARVGADVRRPHLLLHRDDVPAPRRGVLAKSLAGDLPPAGRSPADVAETSGRALLSPSPARLRVSKGAAVTGVEAISNGVPAFKPPGVAERSNDVECRWGACRA